MPFFNYQAKNQHGETIKGVVEAQTVGQATGVLRLRNLLIIKIEPKSESATALLSTLLFGVKTEDIVTFTRQLSTMITAGLSLTESFHILSQQSRPALARLLEEVLRDIEGGNSFSKSLEKHPKYFSRIYIQLVRAGETAGVLDKVLERLAENLEKDKEFRSKATGALIYPTIVIIALVVVAMVMMVVVVPKLTDMYKDFGAELPFATQLLIDISTFFVNFWWLMIAGAVGGVFGLRAWKKTDQGAHAWAKFILRIPIIGKLRRKIILTEFSRTLALLLSAGISLLEALNIASESISLITYRDAFEASAKKVEKGVSLAKTLNDTNLFPPILTQMISVGEETGKLDEVLLKLSVYFQGESEQEIKNLTTAIEPMIMVVLGLGVALMVVAIIMPIYNLTSQF